jgi:thymidylate kinase
VLSGKKDIDLLVRRNQASDCEKILVELGFKRFISQPWSTFPGIEDWIGFDEETGNIVHLHLHYQILSGKKYVKEQILGCEDLILDTAIKDPDVDIFITNPNLELILVMVRIGLKITYPAIIKSLLGNISLPKNFSKEINHLLKRTDDQQLQYFASKILKDEFSDKIISILKSGGIEKPRQLFKLKVYINSGLSGLRRYNVITKFSIYIYRSLLARFSKYFGKYKIFGYNGRPGKHLHNGGMIIAIIGSDGSGKSTVSNEIQKWLSWKIEARNLYLGSGDGSVGFLTRFLKEMAIKSDKKNVSEKKHSKGEVNPSKSLFREIGFYLKALSIANERLKKVKRAHRERIKGSILITDRYPQTQYLGIYDGPKIPGKQQRSKLYRFFENQEMKKYLEIDRYPLDLVIKLLLPPKIALQRKPDHNYENILKKSEITLDLKFPKSTVIEIDASRPLDDVLKLIKKHIWMSL